MNDPKKDPGSLKLLGGLLCLDFTNTVDWRGSQKTRETLFTFQDLIVWCEHADFLTKSEAGALLDKAAKHQRKAEKLLSRAVQLREAIYRIFVSIIENQEPAKKDLAVFNENLAKTMASSKIIKTKEGFLWDFSADRTTLDWVLSPIIHSTADILVSEELKKVKKCADPACGWLFFDISRNQSRRWCDMKDCGNRAKASRFYKKMQHLKISV